MPTYTFPFATVGTANFTEFPGLLLPVFPSELFHNSTLISEAVNAYNVAGVAGREPELFVPKSELSMTQTIPLVVPLDETDGVPPGNPSPTVVCFGVVLN